MSIRRAMLVPPFVALIVVIAIIASTAWHAVSVVHPPRALVDAGEIERELPGAQQVSFLAPDGVTLGR